ncbi:hypothetical protein ACRRTK_003475 [Alexandromys fortis]
MLNYERKCAPPKKKISKKSVSVAILEFVQSALKPDCRKVSDSSSVPPPLWCMENTDCSICIEAN